jgi:putative membrane protein
MKRFNEDFKTRLYSTIKDIENNSLVEIVVLIKQQSGKYRDIALWAGVIFSFTLYTFFMFSPFSFDVFIIYAFTILSFFAVFSLFSASPIIESKFIKQKRKNKNVEIAGRAIFQKAGIRFTSERIGMLIYFSLFEQRVYILPDRGTKNAIPADDWAKMEKDFNSVFASQNIAEAILELLAKYKGIFTQFLPPIENDVNELPDNMDVDL